MPQHPASTVSPFWGAVSIFLGHLSFAFPITILDPGYYSNLHHFSYYSIPIGHAVMDMIRFFTLVSTFIVFHLFLVISGFEFLLQIIPNEKYEILLYSYNGL